MTDPDLATLVADAKRDRSYDRLSQDCGGNPTDKRLQQIATSPLKAFPDTATLQGIARGTSEPLRHVVLAAARSLGLYVSNGVDADDLIIGGAASLTDAQKQVLLTMARMFQSENLRTQGEVLRARLTAALDILKSDMKPEIERMLAIHKAASASGKQATRAAALAQLDRIDGLIRELVAGSPEERDPSQDLVKLTTFMADARAQLLPQRQVTDLSDRRSPSAPEDLSASAPLQAARDVTEPSGNPLVNQAGIDAERPQEPGPDHGA